MSVGIYVEYLVAHTHTQNGLAESLIKRLQLIARPLLLRTKLPLSAWGHAILHVATLIRIFHTTNHDCSHLQLVLGSQPNVSHFRIFGCVVYVPIAPLQCRFGIYVGFNSPSIICYLEPVTSDVFTTHFADCHFDENVFQPLKGDKSKECRDITW